MNENFSPKISVIIPMYNAEKYLSVCLESILIQTLQDYEVIIVDDCSTDASSAIAESYLEKFGGRLKIISLPENTGSGAVPRNVGLEHASGKYVFFMDNDDFLIDDALETLYDFAEEYQAEVLYMGMHFSCDEEPVPADLTFCHCPNNSMAGQTLFEPEDMSVRLEKLFKTYYWWAPWAKFFRRDFLIDNDIIFPAMTISDDIVQTFKVVFLAKRLYQVSPALYVYRQNQKSLLNRGRSPEQEIIFWINPLISGLEYLEDLMSRLEFFKANPLKGLQVLHFFANIHLDHIKDAIKALPDEEVYKIFLREFSRAKSTQPALIAYLLFVANPYRNELIK